MRKFFIGLCSILSIVLIYFVLKIVIKIKAYENKEQEACENLVKNLEKSDKKISNTFEMFKTADSLSEPIIHEKVGKAFLENNELYLRLKQHNCLRDTLACDETLEKVIKTSRDYGQACFDYSEALFLRVKFPDSIEVERLRLDAFRRRNFSYSDYSNIVYDYSGDSSVDILPNKFLKNCLK